ncbi:dematin isoform X1 [Hippoglossus stenolepis]|uniref:dematin isoform X1 n=1 Tax=Hippoglossus stenolepis TaxID=195615 RepID=UPI001FAF9F87|nr:dematin isoform X1 [Hippoglossus stenolepis]
MMPKQLAQTSPGSVLSLRGSGIPGSPAAAIVIRVEDGVIGYKDLAALPRDKAILDIERPDLMIYQPHYSYSPLERSLSPRSISPPPSPENLPKDWLENRSPGGSSPGSTVPTSRTDSAHTPPTPHTLNTLNTHSSGTKSSVLHFHRPENGSNIYKKPPIYKQDVSSSVVPQGKQIEDLIIESSKFPAAQPPDPNLPSKIETDYWPCPPSMAVIEKEWRRKEQRDEDEEEDEEQDDELGGLRNLQKQELNKIQSNLGKIILKEELEKSSTPLRRKTRSLPDRSQNTGSNASRSVCFPDASKSGLSRLQSTEFSSSHKSPAERRLEDGQRELSSQHVGASGLPVRDAGGDSARTKQTASWCGQNQTGAPPLSGGVLQCLRDVHRRLRLPLSLEEERHEEEVLSLLTVAGTPPPTIPCISWDHR